MKDWFKRSSLKDVGIGGWKCFCCNPLSRKPGKRQRDKTLYHGRARSRMKAETYDEIQSGVRYGE